VPRLCPSACWHDSKTGTACTQLTVHTSHQHEQQHMAEVRLHFSQTTPQPHATLMLACNCPVRRARAEARAKAAAHLAAGNVSMAQECYQRCVDVTPAMAKQVIEVSRDTRPWAVVAHHTAGCRAPAALQQCLLCQCFAF
jgi:alkanesulfonate monooxygenase SsuD/methylene tetrahydromethanopterin reductase-like flavin-dependent oxidoreductase (luciferase family)